MRNRPRVTVLGSLNMDISVTVPRLPEPGATVLGSAARFTPGGKGANQAVAAARLGASVRMAGCVGDDDFGRQLLAALREEKVDASGVRVTDSAPTGLAMISVDEAGENIITVAPGANHEVGSAEIAAATREPGRRPGHLRRDPGARDHRGAGPAPGTAAQHPQPGARPRPRRAAAIVAGGRLDWLVVNETEAGAVLGRPVSGLAEAAQAAVALLDAGARHAVVTAGAHGAALADGPGPAETVQAFRVEAVDTVGAGDTFVGALAVDPGRGRPGRRGGPRRRRRGRHRRHPARRPGGHAAPGGHPRGDRPDLARR